MEALLIFKIHDFFFVVKKCVVDFRGLNTRFYEFLELFDKKTYSWKPQRHEYTLLCG